MNKLSVKDITAVKQCNSVIFLETRFLTSHFPLHASLFFKHQKFLKFNFQDT